MQPGGRAISALDDIAAAIDAVREKIEEAGNLALAICYVALIDLNDGPVDDGQLPELAHSFVGMNAWTESDEATVLRFLTALAHGTPVEDVISAEQIVVLAFVMAGWLLAAFPPEDREWTDFLDTVLDRLESASERH